MCLLPFPPLPLLAVICLSSLILSHRPTLTRTNRILSLSWKLSIFFVKAINGGPNMWFSWSIWRLWLKMNSVRLFPLESGVKIEFFCTTKSVFVTERGQKHFFLFILLFPFKYNSIVRHTQSRSLFPYWKAATSFSVSQNLSVGFWSQKVNQHTTRAVIWENIP